MCINRVILPLSYYSYHIVDATVDDSKFHTVWIFTGSQGRFIKPDVEDKADVVRRDIVMCLPKPTTTVWISGSTTASFDGER